MEVSVWFERDFERNLSGVLLNEEVREQKEKWGFKLVFSFTPDYVIEAAYLWVILSETKQILLHTGGLPFIKSLVFQIKKWISSPQN